MILKLRIDNEIRVCDLECFGKDMVNFGRSSDCDIQFNKKAVSRLHGCFYKEKGKWYVKDLNSKYGIYHNGNKVNNLELKDRTSFMLIAPNCPGDEIQITAERGGKGGNYSNNEVFSDVLNDGQEDVFAGYYDKDSPKARKGNAGVHVAENYPSSNLFLTEPYSNNQYNSVANKSIRTFGHMMEKETDKAVVILVCAGIVIFLLILLAIAIF